MPARERRGLRDWVGVNAPQFRLTAGQEALSAYKSSPEAERQFCSKCGSQLFFRSSRWEGEVHVTRATIHGEMSESPKAHVFYSDRADWFQFDDVLPKFGGASGLDPMP